MPVVCLDDFGDICTAANLRETVGLDDVEAVEHVEDSKRFEWLTEVLLDQA